MAYSLEIKYFNSFVLAKTVNTSNNPVWRNSTSTDVNLKPATTPRATLDARNWYIEEARITGGYNNTTVDFGAKAYIVSDQTRAANKASGLIYSGVYNSRTGINNTNQFSVAQDITRSADPRNGSIQKLYAEETNLTIFQEQKVSRALIDKSAIYSAEGNPMTTSGTEIIGQIQAYTGEFGIAKDPGSFAVYGFQKYFTDRSKNAVLRLSNDGITEISNYGMKSYFAKELSTLGNGKIVGGYDIVSKSYILSTQQVSGLYNTVSFDETVNGWTSFYNYKPSNIFSVNSNMYTTFGVGLYQHHVEGTNLDNRGYFYDVYYPSSVTLVLNPNPSASKVFQTINYEGSEGWEVANINTTESAITTSIDTGFNIKSYLEGTFDSSTPRKTGAAALVNPVVTPLYYTGFVRKENKFFANIVNNSLGKSGEIVFGRSMSGIKGFWSTVTIKTDNTTQKGKFKELYSVSSDYVESSY